MSKPYLILRATTIEALEMAVIGHMAAGYVPTGGPFNASAFAPPHNTIAQAVVYGGEIIEPRRTREIERGPEKIPSMLRRGAPAKEKA